MNTSLDGMRSFEEDPLLEVAGHASALAAAAQVGGFGLLVAGGAALAALRPEVFSWGAAQLPPLWGLPAVVLLVTSGLTVAWAAHCARLRRLRIALGMLAATVVLAAAFLAAVFGQTQSLLERGLGWGTAYLPVVEGPVETGTPAAAPEPPPPGSDATTTPLAPQGPPGLRDLQGAESDTAEPPHGSLFFGVVHMGSLVQATWILVGLVAVLWNLGRLRRGGLDAPRVVVLESLARLWQPVVAFGVLVFALLHAAG